MTAAKKDPTDYQTKKPIPNLGRTTPPAKPKPVKLDKTIRRWCIEFKNRHKAHTNGVDIRGWLNREGSRYTIYDTRNRILFECAKYDVLFIAVVTPAKRKD